MVTLLVFIYLQLQIWMAVYIVRNVIMKLHTWNIILLERNITKNYDNDTRHEQ